MTAATPRTPALPSPLALPIPSPPFPRAPAPRPAPPEGLLFTILHSDSWEIRLIDRGTPADGGARHGGSLNAECRMNAAGSTGAEEEEERGGRRRKAIKKKKKISKLLTFFKLLMLLVPPCEPADKLRFVVARIIYGPTRAPRCGAHPKFTKFCLGGGTGEPLGAGSSSPMPTPKPQGAPSSRKG